MVHFVYQKTRIIQQKKTEEQKKDTQIVGY